MPTPIQTQFRVHQQPGWPGSLARPNSPYAYDIGSVNVPSAATRNPQPGDAVYWNATANAFELAVSSTQIRDTLGIIVYDAGTVQSTLASAPSNANSDAFIQYADGDIIKVGIMGTFYVIAGGALEYGDQVDFDSTDGQWDARTKATTIATLALQPIVCVSRSPIVASALAEIRIGYGRAI